MKTHFEKQKVLLVIMDGIGESKTPFGNALYWAKTPSLSYLHSHGFYCNLLTHGPNVGLPHESDMGNSEVGHNTIGAGRVFEQGATLVKESIENQTIFKKKTWTSLIQSTKEGNTLHFLGLLSDGNIHSHENHLYALIEQACKENLKKIRLHILFDGRDVHHQSAETHLKRLNTVIDKLRKKGCDIKIASGGGRMRITMDRYEADWKMVERGWKTHVLGKADAFKSANEAVLDFRTKNPNISDQFISEFVVSENGSPVGKIQDGDGVVLFNFRGDRSIQISKAFEQKKFSHFDRIKHPDVFFVGIIEYDNDQNIPRNFLVSPPPIKNTLGERLAKDKIRQFACSETQKYGHVTYFWNGNRSGYFDKRYEEYLEIPSDLGAFDKKPQMKAQEITDATIKRIKEDKFDFGRINFANGDMVGHTGNFEASIKAVEAVDQQLSRLILETKNHGITLVVTADHGNCEEMFLADEKEYPNWDLGSKHTNITPKTSHTLNPVPFYILDPQHTRFIKKSIKKPPGLANIANTILVLLGKKEHQEFEPALIQNPE